MQTYITGCHYISDFVVRSVIAIIVAISIAQENILMTTANPTEKDLEALATEWNVKLEDEEFANKLDSQDNLAHLRKHFYLPKDANNNGEPYIYLVGNSLGLQPKQANTLINQELKVWANSANMGHFEHQYDRPWLTADEQVCQLLHPLVGSQDDEIAVMASLTADLHLLLCAFYHPARERYKIVLESHAFPSHHVYFTETIANISLGLYLVCN